MARSQNSFIKKQKAEKKKKQQAEKLQRKLDKKKEEKNGDLDSMMAYVDEFGNITSEPPTDDKEPNKKDKNSSKEE